MDNKERAANLPLSEIMKMPEDRVPSVANSEAFIIAQTIIEDLDTDEAMPIDEQREALDELALAVQVMREKVDALRASFHGGIVYRAPKQETGE